MNNRRQFTMSLGAGLASPFLMLHNRPAFGNVRTLQPVIEYQGHRNFVKSIKFIDGGSEFCSITDLEFAKWSVGKSGPDLRLRSNDKLFSMALDGTTSRAFLKSSLRYPIVVDLSNGQSLQPQFDIGNVFSVNSEQRLMFNVLRKDGRQAGVYLVLHDLDSKGAEGAYNYTPLRAIKIESPQANWLNQGGVVSSDGAFIYWLESGQAITGWMTNEERPAPQIFGHRSFVQSMELSQDGTKLLTSASAEVSLWQTASGNQSKSYDFSSSGIRSLGSGFVQTIYGVSPDFSVAVINGGVIDIASGKVMAQLPKPYVSYCALSNDGQIIASDNEGRIAGFTL